MDREQRTPSSPLPATSPIHGSLSISPPGTQAGPLEEGAGGRQQASRSLSDCGDMTQTHDTILSRGRHESEQEGWGQAQLLLWAQAKMRMVRGRKEESSAGLGSDEPWSTPTPTP